MCQASFLRIQCQHGLVEAIARAAGVGIEPLYRHFPTRQALVEAVTLEQVAQLRETALTLLATVPPMEALRTWMVSFAQWAKTKHGMLETLGRILAAGTVDAGSLRSTLAGIVGSFLEAGVHDGSLRGDVAAEDIAVLLAATLVTHSAESQQEQLQRLLQLIADSLRPFSDGP